MKNFKTIIGATLLLLSLGSVKATTVGNPPGINVFYATSTNLVTTPATYSFAFVTSRSGNVGAPAINYISAGTASNNPYVYFWKVASQAPVVATNSTVTLYVANTNGFATATEIMVIEHRATIPFTYEKRVGATIVNSTNLTVDAAPNTTTIPGDMVYLMNIGGKLPWFAPGLASAPAGTNTLNSGNGYFYVGQPGLPIMVELGGATASAAISGVSGVFIPPVRPGQNP